MAALQMGAMALVAICLLVVLATPSTHPRRYYVVCRHVSWGPYPRAEARRLAARWDQDGWPDCGPHRVMTHTGRRLHHARTRWLARPIGAPK